jgi:hypothetical protein
MEIIEAWLFGADSRKARFFRKEKPEDGDGWREL